VDSLYNREITIKNLISTHSGHAKGINNQGNLLLELEDGTVKIFSSGDTTIVKNNSSKP
jgi:biotin-(acetyl-CoA carboxylase) ligase